MYKLKEKLLPLILIVILAILMFMSIETDTDSQHITRNPAVAGTFYPASKTSLENTIESYYENVGDDTLKGEEVLAIIVPHAGYTYSGQTAAFAYKDIADKKTILLLAPSHHIYFHGASIANVTHYKTPLGEIKLSTKTGTIREDLEKASLLYKEKDPHKKEHAIEVQLPFLQVSLTDFEIIPILIGSATDYTDIKKIADILKKQIDESTLIVVSSDFTHYGPRYSYVPFTENIQKSIEGLDYDALEYIEYEESEGFYNYIHESSATICGSIPITILLEIIRGRELKGKLMHYDTSGRITGDYTNSVSYVSYVFYKDNTLNKEEQKYLTTLARNTLESYLKDKKLQEINKGRLSERLTQKSGCFVTLTKDSQLRGCIGHIFPQKPLYQCIIDNSIGAAVRDSRFTPVTYDELDDIHIEVSVLSAPEVLEFASSEELLDKLRPLEDGVVISYGLHKSTYLPQVWEQLPDKVEFLTSLCKKGGASGDCWKKENVKIETYQAQVFGE